MGFSLLSMFETIIIFCNAFAILNEKRFLKKHQWHIPDMKSVEGENSIEGMKNQFKQMMYTMRYYGKYPQIVLNLATMVFELLV